MKALFPIVFVIVLAVGAFLWLRNRNKIDIDHAVTGRWVEGGDVNWGDFGTAVKAVRNVVAPNMGSEEFYQSNHRKIMGWLKGHDVSLSAGNVLRFKTEIANYLASGQGADVDFVVTGQLG